MCVCVSALGGGVSCVCVFSLDDGVSCIPCYLQVHYLAEADLSM